MTRGMQPKDMITREHGVCLLTDPTSEQLLQQAQHLIWWRILGCPAAAWPHITCQAGKHIFIGGSISILVFRICTRIITFIRQVNLPIMFSKSPWAEHTCKAADIGPCRTHAWCLAKLACHARSSYTEPHVKVAASVRRSMHDALLRWDQGCTSLQLVMSKHMSSL